MALQGAAYLLHGQGLHACRPILQLVQGQIKPGQFGHLAEQFAVAVQTQGKAANQEVFGRAQLLLTGPFGHITGQGIARHLQSLGGLIGAGLQADGKRPPIQPRRKIAVHAIGQATFFAHFLGQARSEAATTEHVVAHQQGQVIGVFARDANVPQQHLGLGRGKRKVQLLRSREVRGIG